MMGVGDMMVKLKYKMLLKICTDVRPCGEKIADKSYTRIFERGGASSICIPRSLFAQLYKNEIDVNR